MVSNRFGKESCLQGDFSRGQNKTAMSFTKVYRFQQLNGYESVISRENSDMRHMGFARILLRPQQEIRFSVEDMEMAMILQSGDFTAWVTDKNGTLAIDGQRGTRTNVFDALPTAIYAPPGAQVRLRSEKGMEARVFTAYCQEGNRPYFCRPEDVEEGEPGTYIYKRRYRFIFGAPGKHNDAITRKLIVGESVSVPGGWIGFPGHRHDYVTEKECVLDEIFSYQVRSAGGVGGVMQYGYDLTKDGKKIWDEVNVIESNDTAIGLPVGFHTTVAFPGTEAYLLWGLAGPGEKTYRVQFDERYDWLEDCLY